MQTRKSPAVNVFNPRPSATGRNAFKPDLTRGWKEKRTSSGRQIVIKGWADRDQQWGPRGPRPGLHYDKAKCEQQPPSLVFWLAFMTLSSARTAYSGVTHADMHVSVPVCQDDQMTCRSLQGALISCVFTATDGQQSETKPAAGQTGMNGTAYKG